MTKEEYEKQIKILESEVAVLSNTEQALKILLNSCYGATANPYFRYYDIRLASAVTLTGQWVIRHVENYLMTHPLQKIYGWQVRYSDTDSVFVQLNQLVTSIRKKYPAITQQELLDKLDKFNDAVLQPTLDTGFEILRKYINAPTNKIFMKREKIIESCMWVAKKKYAMRVWDDEGVRYSEPQMKVKGLEIVRSSTPKVMRDRIKESVKKILCDRLNLKFYIKETKELFYNMSAEEIAFPRGVNNIKKYQGDKTLYIKGTPIQVRGSILYNNWVKTNNLEHKYKLIQSKDKIKFIYLRQPNPFNTDVIAFPKTLPDTFRPYVDYKTMFYKTYYKVLENFQRKLLTPIQIKSTHDINNFFK